MLIKEQIQTLTLTTPSLIFRQQLHINAIDLGQWRSVSETYSKAYIFVTETNKNSGTNGLKLKLLKDLVLINEIYNLISNKEDIAYNRVKLTFSKMQLFDPETAKINQSMLNEVLPEIFQSFLPEVYF